ncbi:xylanase [Algoriphagus aestuarii]|nr:xylanase [Algoriphagus aestuarii]
MRRLILFLYFSLFFGLTATSQQVETVVLSLDTASKFQTIDHFGASDAWSIQFVGTWPEDKREAISTLLFSQEMNQGKPTGIGLSMWRMNLGAGTAAQGSESGIKDEWRRANSFLGPDGSLNVDKIDGQLWFANAAKEKGVEKFLLFSNSPPVSLTKNGKGFSEDGSSNLPEQNYSAFAEYVSKVFQELEKHDIFPRYFSPVNEPQWDWKDGGQEGSPYTNEEVAKVVRALNATFEKEKVKAKIDVAEAGKINYLYETADKPFRGNQITDFFDPSSSNFLGDLSHVSNVISAHSYFTTSPSNTSVALRQKLSEELKRFPSLSYWMSEYCILGGNDGEINGGKRDLGMDAALYMARVIHQDLVVSNASAWNWWLAVSPYDYKDGLIYIDKEKENGRFFESKMLWTLGNFSRFIRPGFQRVELHAGTSNKELIFASAYLNSISKELVMVFVNPENQPIEIQFSDEFTNSDSVLGFLTNEESNLEPISIDLSKLIVPKESILTVTISV